jgi:hypothetical protein
MAPLRKLRLPACSPGCGKVLTLLWQRMAPPHDGRSMRHMHGGSGLTLQRDIELIFYLEHWGIGFRIRHANHFGVQTIG